MKLTTVAKSISQAGALTGIATALAPLPRVGIIIPYYDRPYISRLMGTLGKYTNEFNFILAPEATCKLYIVTDPDFLVNLIGSRAASLADFRGSIVEKAGAKYLILTSLEQYRTVDYYEFLVARFIRKLLEPKTFYHAGQFTWEIVAPCDSPAKTIAAEAAAMFLSSCSLIAFDIETPGKDLMISCISLSGYCPATREIKTYVLEFNSLAVVKWLRVVLANPASIKIAQNGQYDISHLLRFSIIPANYLLDTLALFHSWYAELPRSLAFITAFAIANIEYWKDSANGDRYEFLRYNARDSFGTLHACISLLCEMPDWAYANYAESFPTVYAYLLMGMRGLRVDSAQLSKLREEAENDIDSTRQALQVCTGVANFNPGSSKQVLQLFKILGATKLESSDAASTSSFALLHPLNSRLAESITNYRKAVKFHSNYATVELLNGRLHYSINPWGTEGMRSSSSGSHFNYRSNFGSAAKPQYVSYGFQIQNVPPKAKKFIVADPGYEIMEIDYSQAESRTTGYLAQDESLINAVETSPDFHSHNASKFFGISFDELWDTVAGRSLNVPIRNLAKRTNHGANYNMGWAVLIITMGESNMWKAGKLLGLPSYYNLKDIAMYLLKGFCAAYPRLKGRQYVVAKSHAAGVGFLIKENTYYGEIIEAVMENKILTSPLGWTRYCFGNPMTSKPALNEYVAYPSQNLNAHCLKRAVLRIHSKPELRDFKTFKLNAEVHDSLLFQTNKEYTTTILPIVESLMNEPVLVHGRIMVIPFESDKPKQTWK